MVTELVTRHKNPGPSIEQNKNYGLHPMTRVFCRAIAGLILSATTLFSQAVAETGPVTNLPLPRYVSMKASEGNVRRGPSLTHRIDWVFTRRDMPLQITAEHGHWRRVEDREGQGGWVHYSLLSGVRTVIIEHDLLTLHQRPDAEAPVAAALEQGVIARLGKCDETWCRLRSGGYRGWARKDHLWGVAPGEIRD